MVAGIRTIYQSALNKGFVSKFCICLTWFTWRRPKDTSADYNNEEEDDSSSTLSDKNYLASSQKFRQIKYFLSNTVNFYRSVWHRDGSVTITTIAGQSGSGSNDNEEVTLHSLELQNWSLTTMCSLSSGLEHILFWRWGLTPLCKGNFADRVRWFCNCVLFVNV